MSTQLVQILRSQPTPVWAALAVGCAGFVYLLLARRGQRAGAAAEPGSPEQGGRAGFLRRLAAPGDSCPESEWSPAWETSLQSALLRFRDEPGPALLWIAVEGTSDASTLRLRQWVWPEGSMRRFLASRAVDTGSRSEGAVRIVPLRVLAGSADAKLVMSVFKRRHSEVPLFLFLWGKPEVRLMLLRDTPMSGLSGPSVVRVCKDMEGAALRDAEELGAETTADLRRKQAEMLLSAHHNMQAAQL
jgi:hypothetical protein